MQRYLIIIEPTATGFAAYAPDILGCVAAAGSRKETERLMREALQMHVELMRADGLPVPPPGTFASFVDVAA